PTEDLLFLARHDQDLFSRWEALNTLFIGALTKATANIKGGKSAEFDAALVGYAEEIAADDTLEPAYRALALTLPSEADIAREVGSNVEPDAIQQARSALRLAISRKAEARFSKIYAKLEDRQPFSPDAASAGKRSLRNVLLDF